VAPVESRRLYHSAGVRCRDDALALGIGAFRGILKTFIARGNEYMPGTLPREIGRAVLNGENSHETSVSTNWRPGVSPSGGDPGLRKPRTRRWRASGLPSHRLDSRRSALAAGTITHSHFVEAAVVFVKAMFRTRPARSWLHSSSDAWLEIRNGSLPASGLGSQNRHGRGKIVHSWIDELTGYANDHRIERTDGEAA
jgi:hypothetical protein